MMATFDPLRHHRRSIRLKGYDYAQAGTYFVTICAQHRELLFDPEPVRTMIQRWWDKLPEKFPNVETDAFVVMPNHSHGIIVLVEVALRVNEVGADPGVGPEAGTRTPKGAHLGAPQPSAPQPGASLPTVVQWFKTMTTNEYIRGVKELGWAPFPGKLWQRNYYEHIIRNERELNAIRQYIDNNPLKWELDRDNPANQQRQPLPESAADYLKDVGIS